MKPLKPAAGGANPGKENLIGGARFGYDRRGAVECDEERSDGRGEGDRRRAERRRQTESATQCARATEESERNPIFDSLVGPDGEIAGLVAYSIYKQNKRAWLDAFIKATKRIPTEAETRSYIIGESTERRLATYRQLAAATLGGQSIRLRGVSSLGRSGRLTGALWSLVALAALVVIGIALRYSGK